MNPSESQVEMLSAYLDGQLPSDEKSRVEAQLEKDPELRRQLDGLRAVTHNLAHLERMAPPPTLGQDVARRIALAGERR
ncbi:MAG: zf-HC2 domain-containing protein, partial [Acidobacteriota bacterium]